MVSREDDDLDKLTRELPVGVKKERSGQEQAREITGIILRFLRSYRRLSQEELAGLVGLNKTCISDYETAKRPIPLERWEAILVALRLPERAWHETAEHMRWMDWLTEREERRAERYPNRYRVRSGIEILAGKAARHREMELTEMLEMILSGVSRREVFAREGEAE